MNTSMDIKAGKVTEAYIRCIESEKTDPYTMNMLARFFDIDSRKNMDQKIKVLNLVAEGSTCDEIYGFNDILEFYPGDNAKW